MLKKVEYILDNYPDRINKLNASGDTPLHSAIVHHSPEAVKILIGKKADLKLTNSSGKTPKQLAESLKDTYPSLIQVFKDKGL